VRLGSWSAVSSRWVWGLGNTVVFRRGEGVVLFEPSVVAIDERTGRVQAVGSEARQILGGRRRISGRRARCGMG